MPDILDYQIEVEMPFLEELAQDLEDAFRIVAYSEQKNKITYIQRRQEYFSQKYGTYIEHVRSDVGCIHILPAYDSFQNLLNTSSLEEIMHICDETIDQHLMGRDISLEDSVFSPFYENKPYK